MQTTEPCQFCGVNSWSKVEILTTTIHTKVTGWLETTQISSTKESNCTGWRCPNGHIPADPERVSLVANTQRVQGV